jgi:hypothetical protein
MTDKIYDVYITVRFRANSVVSQEELEDENWTIREAVEHCIINESLFGIIEDKHEILDVVPILDEQVTKEEML